MKKQLAIAGLALAAAWSTDASAQSIHSFPGQQTAPETPALVSIAAAQQRAPLNQERAKGTKIFGASVANGNRVPVYFNLYTNDCNNYVTLANIKSEQDEANDPYNIVTLSAAAAAGNDAYYAYKVRKYSIGNPYPVSFEKVDPNTGAHTVVTDLSAWESRWTPVYSMAYDPKTQQLYGLIYGDHPGLDGGVASSLVKIDKTTGMQTGTPVDLPYYYYAIAFNYDGQLYGVSWLNDGTNITGNRLDEIDLTGGTAEVVANKELKVDERAFIGYYQHGLGFDYSTGDLYWFATNTEGYQYLVRINPDNTTTQKLGPTGFANLAIGPHVAYRTGEARNAPAMVTNPTFTADANGDNKVTLGWINPTRTWNRKALTDLSQIYVYRDNMEGQPVAKLDATAGQTMSWEDSGASAGVHTYYIVGVNTAGKKGVPESIQAYVGKDVPGPVANLTAETTDGKTVSLSWGQPTKGDSDGWYDRSTLRYTVVRQPDNKTVATDITETNFTDNTLSLAQTYTYEVTASNALGQGGKTVSNGVLAGNSMSIPFTLDFKSEINAGRFTVVDRNRDNLRFVWDTNSNDSPNKAMKLLLSDYENDDLLITPALNVVNGKSYKVEYTVSFGRMTGYGVEDHWHHFAITAGDAPTGEAQAVHTDIPDYRVATMYQRSKVTGFFTATKDGDFYVGLNVLTKNEKNSWLYVEDIRIIPLEDSDLQAVSVDAPGIVSLKDEGKFTVNVFNAGNKAVSDYSVKVMATDTDGNDYEVCTAASVPALEAKATAAVEIHGCNPAIPAGAGYMLYGVVEMDGDANTDNNMSPAKEVRFVPGSMSLVTGAGRELNTAVPVYFGDPYSATQTVYVSEVTGFDGIGQVTVYGIGVPYSSTRKFEGTKLQVFMSSVPDRYGYGVDERTWLTQGQTKCFEGEVAFTTGDGLMYIEFATPFVYDGSENLVVGYNCLGHKISGDWPVKFAIYDNNWNMDNFHSVRYNGSSAFDAMNPATQYVYSYPYANELYIVADNGSNSVGNVTTAQALRVEGGVLVAPSQMDSVSVYNMQGQLVKRLAPKADRAALGLAPGLYLITVKTADGGMTMTKAAVN